MGREWVVISHHTSDFWQSIVFSLLCAFFFSESMGRDILRGLLEDRVLNQEKMKIEGDGNDTEIDLA